MGTEEVFRDFMSEPATVYPQTTKDLYGKRSFSATGVTIYGRVMNSTDVRVSEPGRTSYPTGKMIVFDVPDVAVNDRLVLSDGTVCQITEVSSVNDENGPHHLVITWSAAGSGA